jgi:hypothetical protein
MAPRLAVIFFNNAGSTCFSKYRKRITSISRANNLWPFSGHFRNSFELFKHGLIGKLFVECVLGGF